MYMYLLFSLPSINEKTALKPNRFKTYQETADTHLTSKSFVATPDCSICLKRMVRGKGSFTKWLTKVSSQELNGMLATKIRKYENTKMAHTQNKTRKHGIDPGHHQSLRNKVKGLAFNHSHHSFHHGRVCKVGRSIGLSIGVFEVFAGLELLRVVCLSVAKSLVRNVDAVGAQVLGVDQELLFADGWEIACLGLGVDEDGCIVANEAEEKHDNDDREKNPDPKLGVEHEVGNCHC